MKALVVVRDASLAAAFTGAVYAALMGHRTDYLGHYLAGFGGTLAVIALARFFRPALDGRAIVAIAFAAIVLGAAGEATVFRIAIFDPVDLCNQSLGACIAAAVTLDRDGTRPAAVALGAFAGLVLAAGFYFAFL